MNAYKKLYNRFEVEWIADNTVTDMTMNQILKCAVMNDAENVKKINSARSVVEEKENKKKRKKKTSSTNVDAAMSCTLIAVYAAQDALQFAYEARIAVEKSSLMISLSSPSNVKSKKQITTTTTTTTKKSAKKATKKVWKQGERISKNGRFMGGTLVVCALSLVGQWQDEAKKFCSGKIKICSYHGGNRCRVPKLLSEFDIVVTTYQTLGADTFAKARGNNKRKKAGQSVVNTNDLFDLACKGKLDTSPCHSVAWYRVIVDESHFIKNDKARMSLATTSLYSKHSLLVTGTPINSSVKDIAGQLNVFQIHHTVANNALIDSDSCQKFFQKKYVVFERFVSVYGVA